MRFGWVEIAIALTLVVLLAHASLYWFLTDDAFISFRYARNLAQGHGLVFNPGFERVEGYTNFLWVLLLAAFDRIGIAPETSAPVLGMAATVALWGLVVWFARRSAGADGPRWIPIVPALLLAATRSVAVWSTSGLETRLFEALMLAGVLRLALEVEARLAGHPRKSVAPMLLALGTLTRPDGVLISGAVLAAAWVWLALRRTLDARALVAQAAAYALPVGAHVVFRLAYYGELLPNTFHAKVNETWWSMGAAYLAQCALEYAAYLWIPLIAVGVLAHVRRGSAHVPILFAAAVLPHALWIASIGGDHFEYRPLDLYFPFAFLLLADGMSSLARGARSTAAVAGAAVVILVGILDLPLRSHAQFVDHYQPGFPGRFLDIPASARFLDPQRDPVYRWPVLRSIGDAYRDLIRRTTRQFVGIRQEEHRLFLGTVVPEGKLLARLVGSGRLPADLYLAISCVGAIPYYSNLRVLDRFGLTDAEVARSSPAGRIRVMAHEKRASREYARSRGVDVWALDPVHTLVRIGSPDWIGEIQRAQTREAPVYVAQLEDAIYMVGELPLGQDRARSRFPALTFRPFLERETLEPILRADIEALVEQVRRNPHDDRARIALGDALAFVGDHAGQIEAYEPAVRTREKDPHYWYVLFLAYRKTGRLDEAAEARRRSIAAMEGLEEVPRIRGLATMIERAASGAEPGPHAVP